MRCPRAWMVIGVVAIGVVVQPVAARGQSDAGAQVFPRTYSELIGRLRTEREMAVDTTKKAKSEYQTKSCFQSELKNRYLRIKSRFNGFIELIATDIELGVVDFDSIDNYKSQTRDVIMQNYVFVQSANNPSCWCPQESDGSCADRSAANLDVGSIVDAIFRNSLDALRFYREGRTRERKNLISNLRALTWPDFGEL